MPVRSIVETPSLFEEQRAFFLEIKPTGAPSMDRPKEKSKRKISFGAGRTERRNTPDGVQLSVVNLEVVLQSASVCRSYVMFKSLNVSSTSELGKLQKCVY